MQNHSDENDFDLHENGREGGTHFHMNGFARRLVLKQSQGNSEMAYLQSCTICSERKYFSKILFVHFRERLLKLSFNRSYMSY